MLSLSRFRDPSPQGNCLGVHSHWSDRRTQFTSVHSSQPFGRVTRCDRISNYRDSRSTYRRPPARERSETHMAARSAWHYLRYLVCHSWLYYLRICRLRRREQKYSATVEVADDCCQCRTHSDDDVMLWHHRSSLCT